MGNVIIVSKTRMSNDNVCVGGVDVDNKRSVRLLNNGYYESITDCPYEIFDIWDINYVISHQRDSPHTEDVNVKKRVRKGVLNSKYRMIDNFVELLNYANIRVFANELINIFDGKLRCTDKGSLYICSKDVPNYSTCFWICDRQLLRNDFRNNIRYKYNDNSRIWGYNIKYVGLSEAINKIPTRSLIRLSLANWWSPEGSNEEKRCYLQLSGFFYDKQA